jgi:hypothetical protein
MVAPAVLARFVFSALNIRTGNEVRFDVCLTVRVCRCAAITSAGRSPCTVRGYREDLAGLAAAHIGGWGRSPSRCRGTGWRRSTVADIFAASADVYPARATDI